MRSLVAERVSLRWCVFCQQKKARWRFGQLHVVTSQVRERRSRVASGDVTLPSRANRNLISTFPTSFSTTDKVRAPLRVPSLLLATRIRQCGSPFTTKGPCHSPACALAPVFDRSAPIFLNSRRLSPDCSVATRYLTVDATFRAEHAPRQTPDARQSTRTTSSSPSKHRPSHPSNWHPPRELSSEWRQRHPTGATRRVLRAEEEQAQDRVVVVVVLLALAGAESRGRDLAKQGLHLIVRRSATSQAPSHCAKSAATKSQPTSSSSGRLSSDLSVKSPKPSPPRPVPRDGKARLSRHCRRPLRPSSSTSSTMRICAPSTPSASPSSKRTYNSPAGYAPPGELRFEPPTPHLHHQIPIFSFSCRS